MSNEQRAAMEQRLAQLRAAQQAAAGGGQGGSSSGMNSVHTPAAASVQPPQQQQQQQHYAPQGGRRPAPQMGYGYDDDDEEDDDDEDQFDLERQQFEDEFLRMLASQERQQQQQQQRQTPLHERNAASVAQVSATRHADEGVDIVATDKMAQRPRELGDFEALRLVKMGDMASMLAFGTACGIDWRTFSDNRGRNALHYAADAGSAALIRKVAGDLHVPYVADEQQLTPLDIAVLNGHNDVTTDEVVAALVEAATTARHADARMADPKAVTSLESVLQAHAPAPPKFVMSKPVPKPTEGSGVRTFWSPAASNTAPSPVQCSSGVDKSAEDMDAVTAAVNALDQHGRFEWLLPVKRGSQVPCERWQISRTVSGGGDSGDGVTSATSATTGIVVAQVLTNAALKGPAALNIKKAGDAPARVAVAAHLGVKGSARRAGVATSLLHALRSRIREEAGDSPSAVAFFASGSQLPRPPTPLATVKWYRRVFDAVSVHASDSAYDVFADFYQYDTVLRADAVLKGALPNSLSAKYDADMPSWCTVDPSSEEQCALVLTFTAAKAGTPESGVDLACVPQDVAELRRSCLSHPDHRTYVRTNAQGVVTDLVVFCCRDARKHADANSDTFAAEVVWALFTSVTGTAKADHMMLLASKLLSAKMLLVPTLFGITESDLAKSNFDELTSCREFIYAVSPLTLSDVDGLSAIPAAKLSLPLYCI
jgi:hypothetical protein